jgi:hypothetical protein
MKLGTIALRIRAAETSFENRVAGAAELALALAGTLEQEVAFVIPLAESSPANTYDNGINQILTERFGVVVALKNDVSQADKTGLLAHDRLHDIRQELFNCLLGWYITGAESLVYYGAGRLLDINRAWLWYQFEFEFTTRLTDEDLIVPDTLDDFDRIYAEWEMSPSANLPYTGSLPVKTFSPDIAELIDLKDLYDASYAKAFGRGFGAGFDREGD